MLAGTFAALGTLPLVFVTEIGFAVAFGVLLDTFVVRSILVTALNLDIGRRGRDHREDDVQAGGAHGVRLQVLDPSMGTTKHPACRCRHRGCRLRTARGE